MKKEEEEEEEQEAGAGILCLRKDRGRKCWQLEKRLKKAIVQVTVSSCFMFLLRGGQMLWVFQRDIRNSLQTLKLV